MKNAGLRITAEVFREDGSTAQTIIFDQRGLSYLQLLELQQKAVAPCASTLMEMLARWRQEAAAAETGNVGSGSRP